MNRQREVNINGRELVVDFSYTDFGYILEEIKYVGEGESMLDELRHIHEKIVIELDKIREKEKQEAWLDARMDTRMDTRMDARI